MQRAGSWHALPRAPVSQRPHHLPLPARARFPTPSPTTTARNPPAGLPPPRRSHIPHFTPPPPLPRPPQRNRPTHFHRSRAVARLHQLNDLAFARDHGGGSMGGSALAVQLELQAVDIVKDLWEVPAALETEGLAARTRFRTAGGQVRGQLRCGTHFTIAAGRAELARMSSRSATATK